jgi:hypothetical protein
MVCIIHTALTRGSAHRCCLPGGNDNEVSGAEGGGGDVVKKEEMEEDGSSGPHANGDTKMGGIIKQEEGAEAGAAGGAAAWSPRAEQRQGKRVLANRAGAGAMGSPKGALASPTGHNASAGAAAAAATPTKHQPSSDAIMADVTAAVKTEGDTEWVATASDPQPSAAGVAGKEEGGGVKAEAMDEDAGPPPVKVVVQVGGEGAELGGSS